MAAKNGKTPLWMASRYGHDEVIKLLLGKDGKMYESRFDSRYDSKYEKVIGLLR